MRSSLSLSFASFVLLVTLAACEAHELPDVPWRSGTRLRARSFSAEGSPSLFTGWIDVERQEACTFREASDGNVRCLPEVISVDHPREVFADASCTHPIAETTASCAVGSYVGEARSCSYGSRESIYRVTGAYVPGSAVYTEISGVCYATSRDELHGYVLEEVPAQAFALAQETVEAHVRLLGRQVLYTGDGAFERRDVVDLRSGAHLHPEYGVGLQFVPDYALLWFDYDASTVYYADAACQEPLVCEFSTTCDGQRSELPPFQRVHNTDDEWDGVAFHEKGPARIPVAQARGPGCSGVPVSLAAKLDCASLGTPLGPDRFPVAHEVVEGTGRLRVLNRELDGELLVDRPNGAMFFDAELAEPCVAERAKDGVMRCLPGGSPVGIFADSACSEPLALRVAYSLSGRPARAQSRVSDVCTPEGGTRYRIFHVVAPIDNATLVGSAYQRQWNEECVPFAGESGSGSTYYTISEQPPEDFVAVTEHVE